LKDDLRTWGLRAEISFSFSYLVLDVIPLAFLFSVSGLRAAQRDSFQSYFGACISTTYSLVYLVIRPHCEVYREEAGSLQ
jgi:hypothetical protein